MSAPSPLSNDYKNAKKKIGKHMNAGEYTKAQDVVKSMSDAIQMQKREELS